MDDEQLVSALTKALNKSNGKGPWWSRSMLVMGPVTVAFLVLLAGVMGFIPFPVMDKLEAMEATNEEYHVEDKSGEAVIISGTMDGAGLADCNADNVDRLQWDDGTPADVNGADLDCDTTPALDESMGGDPTLADGDRLDLIIDSGTGGWLSVCWTFTYDD